jgi:hypothetical protein
MAAALDHLQPIADALEDRNRVGALFLDDRFHETSSLGTGDSLVDSSFVSDRTRSCSMARWRQAVELAMTDEDIEKLTAIARSRSEAARRVARAQILLAYREKSSFFAVGQRLGLHHQTVQRCVERALAYVPLTALDDRPPWTLIVMEQLPNKMASQRTSTDSKQ